MLLEMFGVRVIRMERASLFAWKLDKVLMGRARWTTTGGGWYKLGQATRYTAVSLLLGEGLRSYMSIGDCYLKCQAKFYLKEVANEQ